MRDLVVVKGGDEAFQIAFCLDVGLLELSFCEGLAKIPGNDTQNDGSLVLSLFYLLWYILAFAFNPSQKPCHFI